MSAVVSPPETPVTSASPPAPGSPGSGVALVAAPVLVFLSDAELVGACRSDELDRRRAEGLLIHRMIEIAHRELQVADGYTCMAAWGRGVHRWSATESRARRNLAKLAPLCPTIVQSLLSGRLGVAQAHLIARVAGDRRVGKYLPMFIDLILDAAASFDYADFELYVKEWKQRVDTDGTDPDKAHRHRHASIGFTDTEFRFVLTGPNIDGVEFAALLKEYEQREFDADWAACREMWGNQARPDLMRRDPAQRRYDALFTLIATVGPPTAPAYEDDEPVSDADDRPDGTVATTVNIVIDQQTFTNATNQLFGRSLQHDIRPPFGPGRGFSHTLDGVIISARDTVLAALYGKVRLVVIDDSGVPTQMTSATRLFTGRMRDAVLMTAVRCTHPGCIRPGTECEIDHLTPWSQGGTTDPHNGGPACRHHNNWRHTSGARARLRHDRSWATHHKNGTELAPPD